MLHCGSMDCCSYIYNFLCFVAYFPYIVFVKLLLSLGFSCVFYCVGNAYIHTLSAWFYLNVFVIGIGHATA